MYARTFGLQVLPNTLPGNTKVTSLPKSAWHFTANAYIRFLNWHTFRKLIRPHINIFSPINTSAAFTFINLHRLLSISFLFNENILIKLYSLFIYILRFSSFFSNIFYILCKFRCYLACKISFRESSQMTYFLCRYIWDFINFFEKCQRYFDVSIFYSSYRWMYE